MKRIINTLFAFSLLILVWSCEEDDQINQKHDIVKPQISNLTPAMTESQSKGGSFTLGASITDNLDLGTVTVAIEDWDIDTTTVISGTSYALSLEINIPEGADASVRNIIIITTTDAIGNMFEQEYVINFGTDTEDPMVDQSSVVWSGIDEGVVYLGKTFELTATISDNIGLDKVWVIADSVGLEKIYDANGATTIDINLIGDNAINVPMDATESVDKIHIISMDIAGNMDTTSIDYSIIAPPFPDDLFLVGGSTSADWDPANSIPFMKNDDGIFEMYAYLETNGGGFKLLEIQDWPGDWGMSPGNSGTLVQEGEDNITVSTDGFYRIYVDFNTLSYSVDEMAFGIIGDGTGSWDFDQDMTLASATKGNYTWNANLDLVDGFIKFRANDDWAINYGDTGEDGSLDAGGDNIAVTAGAYTIQLVLDPSGYTYKLIQGPSNLFLVGGSTSAEWDPANSVPFVKTSDGVFEIYTYLETAGGGFKFLELQDWPGDWGMSAGNPGVLEQDTEENVTVPSDGFYRVEVNFNTGTFTVDETTFGLIGDGTGSWDFDQDMTLVSATKGNYSWMINITLVDGAIKFRANDDWAINYGDTGADGSLESSGDNIAVTAGTYDIVMTLDPVAGYSYTIN